MFRVAPGPAGGPPGGGAPRRVRRAGWRWTAAWWGVAWWAAGCAAPPPPDIPVVPLDGWAYVADGGSRAAPVPGEGLRASTAEGLRESWTLIVKGRLGEADRQLAPLRSSAPEDPGVLTAAGFLALRSGRISEADGLFRRALEEAPRHLLAALGSVVALLEADAADPETLFSRLRRLAEVAPGERVVGEQLPGLSLEVAEGRLARARELARANAPGPEVADAYRGALAVMPDSLDLLLEAAEASAGGGARQAAREWFDAVASDPSATPRQALAAGLAAAELLTDERRLAESLTRLDRILGNPGLDGFSDLRSRAGELERRLEVARLSELYDRIREAERVTREQLAALLAAEIGRPAGDEPEARGPVIAIDLERSWARNFIHTAVGAGYLQLYPNHTFQPWGLVTRAELAESLAAALERFDPEARQAAAESAERLQLGDVPAGHRHRTAAALAVELGLLPTNAAGMFRPRAFASGAEAVRAVHTLRDRLNPS